VTAPLPAPAQAGAGTPDLDFTVHGTPAGQGQVSFLGRGRPAIHTNQKTLKPWRQAIIDAALKATGRHQYIEWGALSECAVCRTPKREHALLVGVPVAADITLTVPKPKSAPKTRRTWPITRFSTDIDHHARAVLDSLSAAGVFGDDSQVVELTIRKVYPGEHPQALDGPGAHIRIWRTT